jgi:hypothetical protein
MRLATEAMWTGVAVALVCASSIATSASLRLTGAQPFDRSHAVAVHCERATPQPLVVSEDGSSDDSSRALAPHRYAVRHASKPAIVARQPHDARAIPPNRPVLRRSKTPPPRSPDAPAH